MTSRVTWLDYDDETRRRISDVLSETLMSEANDPLGLGTFQRNVSERLFPGTSTQHTRLRYAVLIPALLQSRPRPTPSGIHARETKVNESLVGNPINKEERGIFGRRSIRRRFLPAYWSALRTWGFFSVDPRHPGTPEGALETQLSAGGNVDEDGNQFVHQPFRWHPGLSEIVAAYLDDRGHLPVVSNIECTEAERSFVLGRWQERTLHGRPTALASIAAELSAGKLPTTATAPWDWVSAVGRGTAAGEDLLAAKHASLVCWALQIAYNAELLRLARKATKVGTRGSWQARPGELERTERRIDRARQGWTASLARDGKHVAAWEEPAAWRRIGFSPGPDPLRTADFLAHTARRIGTGETNLDSAPWVRVVADREGRAKAQLPMLTSPVALASWTGTPEMLGRMDFRWGKLRTLIDDVNGN